MSKEIAIRSGYQTCLSDEALDILGLGPDNVIDWGGLERDEPRLIEFAKKLGNKAFESCEEDNMYLSRPSDGRLVVATIPDAVKWAIADCGTDFDYEEIVDLESAEGTLRSWSASARNDHQVKESLENVFRLDAVGLGRADPAYNPSLPQLLEAAALPYEPTEELMNSSLYYPRSELRSDHYESVARYLASSATGWPWVWNAEAIVKWPFRDDTPHTWGRHTLRYDATTGAIEGIHDDDKAGLRQVSHIMAKTALRESREQNINHATMYNILPEFKEQGIYDPDIAAELYRRG